MTKTEIANLALSFVGGNPIFDLDTDVKQQAQSCRKWFDTAAEEALKSHFWNFASKRYRAVIAWTSISGVSNNGSGLIRVTATSHGLTTGDRVSVKDVSGVSGANGSRYVTVVNANAFDLQGSVFSGSYTSGGSFTKIPLFGWSFFFALPSDLLAIQRVNGREGNEEDSIPYAIEGELLLSDVNTLELQYTFSQLDTAKWTKDFANIYARLLASYIAQDLTGPAGRAADLREQYEALVRQTKARDSQQGKGHRLTPGWDSPVIASRFRGRY